MILSYARVSTAEQASDGATSIAEQKRKNKALATMRGVDILGIAEYIDAGVSGAVPFDYRPQGHRLLKDAQAGDIIIASKLDRMFRSLIDSLQTVEELRERGIGLILPEFGTEPIEQSATAKLFFSLLGTFAEFERGRTAERTSEGRQAKKEIGGHLGGSPPFGYRVEGEGRHSKLVVHPDEQQTLVQVKQLYKTHTPAAAAREAARIGLRDRAGSPFRIGQIVRLAQRQVAL